MMTSNGEIFDVIIIGCGPAGVAAAIDFQFKFKQFHH
jgi:cation diffusion facilitator CzcD-associated flavoprotein CzcO